MNDVQKGIADLLLYSTSDLTSSITLIPPAVLLGLDLACAFLWGMGIPFLLCRLAARLHSVALLASPGPVPGTLTLPSLQANLRGAT